MHLYQLSEAERWYRVELSVAAMERAGGVVSPVARHLYGRYVVGVLTLGQVCHCIDQHAAKVAACVRAAIGWNAVYQAVLDGSKAGADVKRQVLLACLHLDNRKYVSHYWKSWVRDQMTNQVEVRLQQPAAPDQWFSLHRSVVDRISSEA
jgi:hypothetical protein